MLIEAVLLTLPGLAFRVTQLFKAGRGGWKVEFAAPKDRTSDSRHQISKVSPHSVFRIPNNQEALNGKFVCQKVYRCAEG